jgi:hypothetical protein
MNNNQALQESDNHRYCSRTFAVAGVEVKNYYLCDQSPFTVADLWKVEKQKRPSQRRHEY